MSTFSIWMLCIILSGSSDYFSQTASSSWSLCGDAACFLWAKNRFFFFCLVLLKIVNPFNYNINTVTYVFLLLCLYILIMCLCNFIVPAGTLRLPWLRFFRAFSSIVRQMPGYNSQRWGTARILPNIFVFYVLFVLCRSVYFFCV